MLSASRCNPLLAPFYRRLLERGKSKKLAYIACARKLLVMLNAMFRDHSPWNPTLIFNTVADASEAQRKDLERSKCCNPSRSATWE